jgi:hypothetical protein
MIIVSIAIKRCAYALFLATVLGGTSGHSQSIQWWPEIDLSLTVNRTNLLIPSLTRLAPSLPNPQFVATGAVGTFSVNRHWSVSAGYLFADLPQASQVAHVPLVAFTPSWKVRRWTIADINRFERLIDFSNQPYRYRNRAIADRALGQHHSLHLYASNEFFENLSSGSWNQNRAQLGVGLPVHGSVRLDAYFLQRSAPGGKQTSVFGTVLTLQVKAETSH